GGADPDMNPRLRQAIINAKAENMPKDNIDAAIKRATAKDAADMVEIVYEGKGPAGVLVVVECATDNTTRTVANVRSYFNKCGGSLVPSGSLEFMFSRKAVFELELPEGMEVEEIELELIDAGLEEIEATEEGVVALSDWTAFGTMQTALEKLGINVKKANLQRFANSPVAFSAEDVEAIEKFLEKVEDDEDVQSVYTNME
ncbi:MAG: YebC/PmpR family DNA-binding transcriptional regulator, partial [Bacteroidales bacterium]|nr:YebC/PmpR family DNA-binding transcriptional regulator [Bacteroidales bacterium]